jgi:hypothetical protein
LSRLVDSSGADFASGEAACVVGPGYVGDRLDRLQVHVGLGQRRTRAVVDTGGAFLLLDPQLAAAVGIERADSLGHEHIRIRGFVQRGTVHRLPVTLLATAGESLTFEATAFVPELDDSDVWPLPSYLGWQGCLERIRFAVDPVDEVVYFGAADG